MITTGMMYWLTRLDYIHMAASVILYVTIAVAIMFGVAWIIAISEGPKMEEDKKSMARWGKKLLAIITASGFVVIFCPTTKEMAAIYIIPAISQNEDVAKIIKDVPSIMQLGTQWVKETIQESVDKKVEHRNAREYELDRV